MDGERSLALRLHGALDMERIGRSIAPRRVGRRLAYRDTVTSTNDVAWAEACSPDADGLVVLAEHQTGGRGRLGRPWRDARGASVLCSVLLVDDGRKLSAAQLALAPCVAAAEAIEAVVGVRVTLKWPNDLLYDGRKLGGVLVESRPLGSGRAWVIGIGINCLQHAGHFDGDLSPVATSLDLAGTRPVDRSALVAAVLTGLDCLLASPQPCDLDGLRQRWMSRTAMIGSRVSLRRDGETFSGTVVDLDPTASLVVQLDGGGVRAFSVFDTSHDTGPLP